MRQFIIFLSIVSCASSTSHLAFASPPTVTKTLFPGRALEAKPEPKAGSLPEPKAGSLPEPKAGSLPEPKAGNSRPAGRGSLHVVVDPGHGGVDTGATRDGVKESKIALAVSLELARLLREDSRFEVTLTRESDEALTLEDRAHVARRAKADLFISIHCNASDDPRAQGVEFYFQNQLPADEESLFLASRENQERGGDANAATTPRTDENVSRSGDVMRILDDLQRNYRISASHEFSRTLLAHWHAENRKKNRGAIRQAPFHVVSEVSIPSVLVELGFLSHANERRRLSESEHQKVMARNLFDGIVEFKQFLDNDRAR